MVASSTAWLDPTERAPRDGTPGRPERERRLRRLMAANEAARYMGAAWHAPRELAALPPSERAQIDVRTCPLLRTAPEVFVPAAEHERTYWSGWNEGAGQLRRWLERQRLALREGA